MNEVMTNSSADPANPARGRPHCGAAPDQGRSRAPGDCCPYALAYLGRILPVISETFVVREIVALRRLGLSVQVFSLHPRRLRCAIQGIPPGIIAVVCLVETKGFHVLVEACARG